MARRGQSDAGGVSAPHLTVGSVGCGHLFRLTIYGADPRLCLYLTESVYKVVLQKTIPPQIYQLILIIINVNSRICAGVDFCQMTLWTLSVRSVCDERAIGRRWCVSNSPNSGWCLAPCGREARGRHQVTSPSTAADLRMCVARFMGTFCSLLQTTL